MKAFLTQMATDGKLALKNIFLWITIGFLIIIVVSVNFFLPKESTARPLAVAHYGMDLPGRTEAGSIAELEEMVRADDKLIGVYEDGGELVVLTNHVSDKQAAAALAGIGDREKRHTGCVQP